MLTVTPANQICPLISPYAQAFSQNLHEFPNYFARLSWYQQNDSWQTCRQHGCMPPSTMEPGHQ